MGVTSTEGSVGGGEISMTSGAAAGVGFAGYCHVVIALIKLCISGRYCLRMLYLTLCSGCAAETLRYGPALDVCTRVICSCLLPRHVRAETVHSRCGGCICLVYNTIHVLRAMSGVIILCSWSSNLYVRALSCRRLSE